MTISGERVTLRPLAEADVDPIAAILAEPDVAEWWPRFDRDRVARELLDGKWYAIEHEGEVVGLIGWYEEDDPDYRHAGIDVTLATDWHGRGLGTDSVATLARWLVDERGHHRLIIDPSAQNPRAIRCYERVGFKPVGVMRRYERGPDGEWRDSLLMDVLAEELRR